MRFISFGELLTKWSNMSEVYAIFAYYGVILSSIF